MVKIWFDTEFMDDGHSIDLISIGLVRQDGAEYYAETAECDYTKANPWVQENVIKHLTGVRKPREQIAHEIMLFAGRSPEFWAWFGAYDWVALCQLYGTMLSVPPGWPNLFNEIVQFGKFKANGGVIPNFKKMFPNDTAHHALADAKWNKQVWDYINSL